MPLSLICSPCLGAVHYGHESKDGDNHGSFQILSVYYGLLILSRPVVLWNIVAVLVNSLTVGAYIHFVRKEKGGQRSSVDLNGAPVDLPKMIGAIDLELGNAFP